MTLTNSLKHAAFVGGLAIAMLTGGAAYAQSVDVSRQALEACSNAESAPERLTCYEAVFSPVTQDVVDLTAEPEDVNLTGSRVAGDESAAAEKDLQRAAATIGDGDEYMLVVTINTDIPGRARFITDDNRVFNQSGPASVAEFPEPPFLARVMIGATGGKFFVFENGRRVRVAEAFP